MPLAPGGTTCLAKGQPATALQGTGFVEILRDPVDQLGDHGEDDWAARLDSLPATPVYVLCWVRLFTLEWYPSKLVSFKGFYRIRYRTSRPFFLWLEVSVDADMHHPIEFIRPDSDYGALKRTTVSPYLAQS